MTRTLLLLTLAISGCGLFEPKPDQNVPTWAGNGCQWRYQGQPAGFDGTLFSPDAVAFLVRNDPSAESRLMKLWWGIGDMTPPPVPKWATTKPE